MKLISMVDFIENLRIEMLRKGESNFKETKQYFDRVFNYSDFLKQLLELWMFVPCDESGNILNEPNIDHSKYYTIQNNGYLDRVMFNDDVEIYEQAKEKVLFEIEKYEIGILNGKRAIWINSFAGQIIDDFKFLTVEDLVSKSFQLTPTAIKQIQP